MPQKREETYGQAREDCPLGPGHGIPNRSDVSRARGGGGLRPAFGSYGIPNRSNVSPSPKETTGEVRGGHRHLLSPWAVGSRNSGVTSQLFCISRVAFTIITFPNYRWPALAAIAFGPIWRQNARRRRPRTCVIGLRLATLPMTPWRTKGALSAKSVGATSLPFSGIRLGVVV